MIEHQLNCAPYDQFREAAHNGCNLQLKKITDIPVFFHNLSGYDGHIIFQNLTKIDSVKEPHVVAKVLENIPLGINERLCRISANAEVFQKAVPPYQEALYKSGYTHKLELRPHEPQTKKKKRRKKEII